MAMRSTPRVVISNATRLHAHRHAYALQQAGLLQAFVTSLWNKPDTAIGRLTAQLPAGLKRHARSFYDKRSHPALEADRVVQVWSSEVARLAAAMLPGSDVAAVVNYLHKVAYDRQVAQWIRRNRHDIFVGFEISCMRSFRAAKRQGALTVLDMAGLDHRTAARMLPCAGAGQRAKTWLNRNLSARKRQELALADYAICTSGLAKRSLVENGFDPKRVTVIHLGTDLATFAPAPRETLAAFRFLYAGNLSKAKGVDQLVRVFADLALPDSELVLVGSPADLHPEGLLKRHTPSAMIRHIPYVSQPELAQLMSRSDVFVLPSLLDSWGMVTAEAMASGTPVIVTSHCGSSELVTDATGWVIPAASDMALSEAMRLAYHRRAELPAMGAAARRAVEGLTWEAYEQRIGHLMADLWNEHRSGCRHRMSGSLAA